MILSNTESVWKAAASEFLNRDVPEKIQIAALLADQLAVIDASNGEIDWSQEFSQIQLRASFLLGKQISSSDLEKELLSYVFSNISESDEKLLMIEIDADFRDQVRILTRKIRKILNQVELDENVRHLLIQRLNNFENDLDRTRTRIDSFCRFLLDLTKTTGDGAENLKPAVELAQKVTGMMAGAVDDKDTKLIDFKSADPGDEIPF